MGGHGSGRYYRSSSTTTIEETKRVDIRYMRGRGMLRPGSSGLLTWSRRGEPSGSANYQSFSDHVELSYRYNGEDETIRVTIPLSYTPCHIGGERAWFHCPACKRRCEVLCFAGRWPACRKCYRLPYQSQLDDQLGRLQRRHDKLEAMLWGNKRKWWRKPKREKLTNAWERIGLQYDHAFVLAAANIIGPNELDAVLGPGCRDFS